MKNNQVDSALQVLALPVLVGFITTLILMAICSFVILIGKISNTQISFLSIACLGLGSFFTAFIASSRAKQKRLLWGLVAGACLFGCMALVSLLWLGQTVDFMRVLINFTAAAITAILGSLLGASMKRKRYKPNHKK